MNHFRTTKTTNKKLQDWIFFSFLSLECWFYSLISDWCFSSVDLWCYRQQWRQNNLSVCVWVCECVSVWVCVPPAASCVVLFHVFDEVDLLGVSRSGRTTREVSRPTERERERESGKIISTTRTQNSAWNQIKHGGEQQHHSHCRLNAVILHQFSASSSV